MTANGRSIAVAGSILAGGLSWGLAGCSQPGYRTEVRSGEQGRVEVKRVAVDPSTFPPSDSTRSLAGSDNDFATVESLWPQLTPADRKHVADLARELAAQPR